MKILLFIISVVFFPIFLGCVNSSSTNNAESLGSSNSNSIPGLQPVDVYLNLEKIDFVTEKNISSEYGNSWICKGSDIGIEYTVDMYSQDIVSLENIRATASLTELQYVDISSTKQFFKYIASVPYDNSNPSQVSAWIDHNFNNDNSSIIVSDVVFTMQVPSNFSRTMIIEKAKESQ
jgi:hypothetical protein